MLCHLSLRFILCNSCSCSCWFQLMIFVSVNPLCLWSRFLILGRVLVNALCCWFLFILNWFMCLVLDTYRSIVDMSCSVQTWEWKILRRERITDLLCQVSLCSQTSWSRTCCVKSCVLYSCVKSCVLYSCVKSCVSYSCVYHGLVSCTLVSITDLCRLCTKLVISLYIFSLDLYEQLFNLKAIYFLFWSEVLKISKSLFFSLLDHNFSKSLITTSQNIFSLWSQVFKTI